MSQGLAALDLPYVIENVEGAPLIDPVRLCRGPGARDRDAGVRDHDAGSSRCSAGRAERREPWRCRARCPGGRRETTTPIEPRACAHESQGYVVGVYGNPGGSSTRGGLTFGDVAAWREAMGIDWMLARELRESIPPAYTEHIGRSFP